MSALFTRRVVCLKNTNIKNKQTEYRTEQACFRNSALEGLKVYTSNVVLTSSSSSSSCLFSSAAFFFLSDKFCSKYKNTDCS